jgi:hypothetical protein
MVYTRAQKRCGRPWLSQAPYDTIKRTVAARAGTALEGDALAEFCTRFNFKLPMLLAQLAEQAPKL